MPRTVSQRSGHWTTSALARHFFNSSALASIALLFTWPFLVWVHTLPLGGFYAGWSAVAWGLGSLLIVFTPRQSRFACPLLAFLPLAACLWLLVQLLWGLALYPSTYLLSCLALLWATALMIASRAIADQIGIRPIAIVLASALVLGGSLNTLAAILQHWDIHTFLDRFVVSDQDASTAFGNMGQNNHLADYLGLGLTSLLYLAGYAGLQTKYVVPLGAWLLFGLSLTGSRSAWLYLTALAALAMIWRRRSGTLQSRAVTRIAISGLPIFFALQFLLPKLFATATMTATERLSQGNDFGIRLTLWRHAWEMFASHPVLGVGYENFAWNNFLLTAQDLLHGPVAHGFRGVAFSQAHNLPLQWMAEWGVGGGVLMLFMLYWLVTRFKRFDTPEGWWGWGVLSILGIHSMLEFPLYYTFFLGVAAVVVGLIEDRPALNFSLPPRAVRVVAGIALLGGGALLAVLQYEYRFLQRVYTYDPASNPSYTHAQMTHDLMRANASGFFAPQVELYFSTLPVGANNPKSWPILLYFNSRSSHRAPSADLVYRQALLLSLNGKTQAASALLEDNYLVFPGYMPPFLQSLKKSRSTQPAIDQISREGLALLRLRTRTHARTHVSE